MGDSGMVRFSGNLDAGAQEFRPCYYVNPQGVSPYGYYEMVYAGPVAAYVSPNPTAEILTPALPPPSTTPTRALLLSSVPAGVSESVVRRELEVFGDVRAVQMERVGEGIVAVHFYDLRAAHAALEEIRHQHMQQQSRLRNHYSQVLARTDGVGSAGAAPPPPPPGPGIIAGRAVWAQFMIPAVNAYPDGQNQGTLVVFNLDSQVSDSYLKEVFEAFGPVKELRETPMKKHQKFVEFYDVRDAAKALSEMNGQEIHGKQLTVEFSRPGGYTKRWASSSSSLSFLHRATTAVKHPPPPPPSPPYTQPRPPPSRPIPRRAPPNLPPRAQPTTKRTTSTSSSEDSIETSMGGLTLRRNGKKGINSNTSSNCIVKQKQEGKRKGRQKSYDPRFMIKEDAILESHSSGSGTGSGCRDTRTTVMIKNIPNKYSQKLLLNMLDNHCIHCNEQIASSDDPLQPFSSFDFLYLPIDFNNKCNVGYGFVNMTSPEGTLRLYKAFHNQHWEVFNSRKICEVTYARVQGLEALKEHFKNSKFACETDEYLPVVFDPPRDGRHLTPPLTIVPHLLPSPSDAHVDGLDSSTSTTPTTAHEDPCCCCSCRFDNDAVSINEGEEITNGGDVTDGNDEGCSTAVPYCME